MRNSLLVVSLLLTNLVVYSQNQPFGFLMNDEEFDRISTLELSTFDHNQLLAEDTHIEWNGGRKNVGRLIPYSINDDLAGEWSIMPNGDKIWQLRFRTANAKGVSVYFDDLYIPEGANMVLYPSSRKYFAGPFLNEDCNDHGHFVAGEVVGEEAILEYYQPASVIGDARIGIRGFGHFYRDVYNYAEEEALEQRGGSQSCEVDVNCPEGSGWEAQRDAVVRLTIVEGQFIGYCSGSMINTLVMDCRRYLLTAFHCGVDVTDAEWLDCSVLFKYQSTNCGSGAASQANNKVGVLHLADSDDGGGNNGSDYLLLEIEDVIPSSFNVFYAGWDANSATPEDVVGIHHPAGDRKKISKASNIVSGTYGAPGYHWQVIWMETATGWGVTEGGSSGSPIFNNDKRIVGQLSGGLSCCTDGGCDPPQWTGPAEPDFYGKFDKNWNANPNITSQELKAWLDPNNTGVLAMDGSYVNSEQAQPCSPATSIHENDIKFEDITLYPSVADETITITSSKYKCIANIRIHDTAGQFVSEFKFNTEKQSVSLNDLANGVYYITFISDEGNHITKKFIVTHR